MSTSLNTIVAGRTTEPPSAAKRHEPGIFAVESFPEVIALRLAQASDERELKILAALDEQSDLSGQVLLALLTGELVAAISLADGRVIADPFVSTSHAVSLLRLRADQLVGAAMRRRRRRWLPRFA